MALPSFPPASFENNAILARRGKTACLPLEEQKIITTEYARAIIYATEQTGPSVYFKS